MRGGWSRAAPSRSISPWAPWTTTSGAVQASPALCAPVPASTTVITPTLQGVQAGELQSGGLGAAQPDVRRLHRLARGPLHQVVDGRGDHEAPRLGIAAEADVAHVGPAEQPWIGVAVQSVGLLDDAQERLRPGGGAEGPPEFLS